MSRLLVLLLALATGGTAVTAAQSGPALTATFTRTSTWNSGYGADYVITNTGDAPATGWTVEFDLPAGTTVTSSWSAVRVSTGNHHSFTNVSWNGAVAAGGTVSFGFNVAALGVPRACTINGAPCAGGTAPTTSPTSTPTPSPSPSIPPPPAGSPVVDVSTAAQLTAALVAAQPGQTIRLAPGIYNGAFLGRATGTATAPITVTGPATAVLTNPESSGTNPGCSVPAPGFDPGYGFWLYGAAHWRLNGFTVTGAAKGIMIDASPHVTVDSVTVRDIGAEGVHFRRSWADGIIQNSRIERTGTAQPAYGEGSYLGSAHSNWSCYGTTGGIDASDRIQVLNNHVGPDVAAEHVDVKEGTVGGVIRGNTWNGQGLAGQNSADSWLDVKGSNYDLDVEVPGQPQHRPRLQHRHRRDEWTHHHRGHAVRPGLRRVTAP